MHPTACRDTRLKNNICPYSILNDDFLATNFVLFCFCAKGATATCNGRYDHLSRIVLTPGTVSHPVMRLLIARLGPAYPEPTCCPPQLPALCQNFPTSCISQIQLQYAGTNRPPALCSRPPAPPTRPASSRHRHRCRICCLYYTGLHYLMTELAAPRFS